MGWPIKTRSGYSPNLEKDHRQLIDEQFDYNLYMNQ